MPVRLPTRRLSARATALPLVALIVLTTFACSLDKLTQPEAGASATLSATVSGDSTVSLGATIPMRINTATGQLPAGVAAVIWSSDKPAIATVDAATGVVTGVGVGTATISATVAAPEIGEVTATALTIRVRYAGIKITAVDSLIAIGMTKVIIVRGTNTAGALQATIPFASPAMTVQSRDAAIFDVNTSGALVARANGTARLFVQYDGLKDSLNVKVRQVARSIAFVGAAAGELPIGSLNLDRTLAVTARDSLGVAITTPTVSWATSDATTVTVGAATGVARALKLGTATITATVDGLASPILARVTQVPKTLTKVAGDALSAVVNTVTSAPPRVAVLDSGSTPIPGVSVTFTVASGGGTVTGGTQTTAAVTGQAAATSWMLGTTAGANTLLASAGGASQTFTATGTAAAAIKLIFTTQPTPAAIGASIATIRVAVADTNDNVVTTATNSITLALGTGTGTLGGTLTAPAVNGVATFSNITLSAGGTFTLSASTGGLTSATSNAFSIFGAATKLGFTTQPVGGTSGQVLPTLRVAVQDAAGNTVVTATNTITLSVTTGTGTTPSTLGGTVSAAAVDGVATFTNVTISPVGTAYSFTAAATGLTSATSNTFNIVAVGPATKLAFTVQPSNVVAGVAIAPSIQVTVQDVGGATSTGSTQAVTLAFETNTASGTLSGTLTVNAAAGVATFPGISVNRVGTGYRLNATGGTLTKAVSGTFNVTVGTANKLAFATAMPNAVVSTAITPAIQVLVQDALGNTVSTSTAPVTLTASGGGGGALAGGGSTGAVAGVATFSAASIPTAGSNYQIVAASTGLTSATSTTFNVVSATAPIKLAFVTHPSNVASGASIAPSIQVAVQDASGATVTTPNSVVTLSLGTNPTGSTISGALAQTTSGGIATFTNINVALVGTGYTINAAASGLTAATSNAFNVTPGTASKLAFITQPANVTAGVPFANDIQVQVQDAGGNLVPTATNVVTLGFNNNPGSSQLRGTTSVAAVNGVATFPGVNIPRSGVGYVFFASASSLNGATSLSFDVAAAPASALAFKTQPQNVTAGALQTAAVQVQVVDSVGNVITTATNAITLAINSGPTGATITGTATVNAVAGIATFTDVKFPKSGNTALAATASVLATATSFNFFVSAGPASTLVWIDQPQNTVRNAVLTSPGNSSLRVDVQDAFGNTIFASSASITVAVTTNPGTATLTGTATVAASNGQAVFNTLKLSAAGVGYRLTATSTNLTSAVSSTFDLAAFGTATTFGFIVQPSNTTGGTKFVPAPRVAIQDQFGNTVTSAAQTTVHLFISNNPGSAQIGGITAVNTDAAGVATFDSVFVTKFGTSYTLLAGTVGGSSTLNSAVSAAFNVAVGPAAKLDWNVQPSNTTGGVTFTTAPKVSIADLGGNVVTTAPLTSITVALTTPGTATLGGTKIVSTAAGVATFSTLTVDKSNNYSLTATAPGLTAAQSDNFFVAVGPAAKLAFTRQPSTTYPNAPMNPGTFQIEVTVQDLGGNTVFGATNPVTFAIGTNPTTATISGTLTTAASFGSATINSDVKINKAGTGFTLVATATGLTSATSTAFNVDPFSTANKLAFTVQPGAGTRNVALSPAPKVSVLDQYGNVVTSSTLSVTMFFGSGPSGPSGTTTVAAISGVATFSNLSFSVSGNHTIFAGATGVNGETSATFSISGILEALAAAGSRSRTQSSASLQ